MTFQHTGRASRQRSDLWQSLVGQIAEVRLDGGLYRRGVVDEAMPDSIGLWLDTETVSQLELIDATSGFEVWTSLYSRSRWDNAGPASEKEAEAAEAFERIPARSGDQA